MCFLCPIFFSAKKQHISISKKRVNKKKKTPLIILLLLKYIHTKYANIKHIIKLCQFKFKPTIIFSLYYSFPVQSLNRLLVDRLVDGLLETGRLNSSKHLDRPKIFK